MHFLPENIDDYAVAHSQAEPELLKELHRETWQKVLNPRMLSGAYQGRLLSLLSKIVRPKRILEIGTYTGYATLCLAEGLSTNGMIFTIDINEELQEIQQKYFNKSDYKNQIVSLVGNALEIIPDMNEAFDMVFIDADKSNYIKYFDLILPKMTSGGLILTDNVLWSGKVIEKLDPKDLDTKVLLAYNKKLNQDDRIETVLLPIRDGLTLTRVK